MSRTFSPDARGNLSLILSALALLVAMSGTAYALANGSVKAKHLATNSVTTPKIKSGAVTAPKIKPGAVTGAKVADGSLAAADLADNAVTGATVADGSLRLSDLGGSLTDQTTTIGSPVAIASGQCATLSLRLFNPPVPELHGSLVVGTITNSSGGAVVSNSGIVVPTLVTETSQGGSFIRLGVCAGSSAQNIPAGSIVTWSLVEP